MIINDSNTVIDAIDTVRANITLQVKPLVN